MRVGLCQINPLVGDLAGNASKIARAAREVASRGGDIAVFPELSLTGYPPRDLLERPKFVEETLSVLHRLASDIPPEVVALVGFADRNALSQGRRLHNAAAVIERRRVAAVVHKRLLPTYDVFDEDRYFEPGRLAKPIEVAGTSVGVTICEDAWSEIETALAERTYRVRPIGDLIAAGAEVIFNLSASPFTLPKRRGREEMFRAIARKNGVPFVFVNQVGGNDELIFDGASAVYGPEGEIWTRLESFEEEVAVVDLGPGHVADARRDDSDESAALQALVLGTRDYARKCGFRRAVLGLSGGIDSAVVACVAAQALGPENVLGFAMPSRYSSPASLEDAAQLARNLGVELREQSIEPMFEAFLSQLASSLEVLGASGSEDTTFENLQSRIRCAILMAVSNRTGALLLTTGNKSELAVGYCTLYGDMAGGLALLSDVPKTFVYRLARYFNRQAGRDCIPTRILEKAPSAELRPDQRDSDTLPPYDVLDGIIERYVEEGLSPAAIVEQGYDAEVVRRVVRMILSSEYKRRQMPPGLILTRKAFGPGRRYPIACGYRG